MENHEVHHENKHKKIHFIYISIIIILVLCILFHIIHIDNRNKEYNLIDSRIAELEINEFLEEQKHLTIYYKPLKDEIVSIIDEKDIVIGYYFEDLKTGAWIGINEKEEFIPASLLKVPTAAAAIKMVEEGNLNLEDSYILDEDNLNWRFGELYRKGPGTNITTEELLEFVLTESDNTASNKLRKIVPIEKVIEARLAMGLPITTVMSETKSEGLSPKQYSNIFRTLYKSAYLSREGSNYILSLLSETKLDYGLRADIPKSIRISHKIGSYASDGSKHDCGIIYAENPYILCIMTKEKIVSNESSKVIEELSEATYNFIKNH